MSRSYDSKSYDSLRFRNETKFAKKALELEKRMNKKRFSYMTKEEFHDEYDAFIDFCEGQKNEN